MAAARPAGPDPTTATLLPVRTSGGSGTIHPSLQPLSAIAFSMYSDRHGIVVDVEDARPLARGRTYPAVKLGKVVGGVKLLKRLLPPPAIDEVVEVRDDVAQRTPAHAERHRGSSYSVRPACGRRLPTSRDRTPASGECAQPVLTFGRLSRPLYESCRVSPLSAWVSSSRRL